MTNASNYNEDTISIRSLNIQPAKAVSQSDIS